MRSKKGIIFILMLAFIMILTITHSALAQRGKEGPTVIEQYIDKNASGTKVVGNMTIFYELVGDYKVCYPDPSNTVCKCKGCYWVTSDFYVDMYFFMSLSRGGTQYIFSGPNGTVTLRYALDVAMQGNIIHSFFENEVIPSIFGGPKPFAFKSVKFVDAGPSTGDCCPNRFTVMDIELAVIE